MFIDINYVVSGPNNHS